MSKKVIGVYGASGFGREVMPIIHSMASKDHTLVFIDDAAEHSELNGYSICSYGDFLKRDETTKKVAIAIADCNIREKLHKKIIKDGVDIIQVVASNTMILDNNHIADGAILCSHSTITSNVKIGQGFHCNIYSYVAHDCIIGDFVTFAPRVSCNGNVHVEDRVYIGTGAVIKQGTPDKPLIIGKGAVIGMGAVVTKSVKPGDVVFGNPAKTIKRTN